MVAVRALERFMKAWGSMHPINFMIIMLVTVPLLNEVVLDAVGWHQKGTVEWAIFWAGGLFGVIWCNHKGHPR